MISKIKMNHVLGYYGKIEKLPTVAEQAYTAQQDTNSC